MIKVQLYVNATDPLQDLTLNDQTPKQNPFTNRIREKHDLALIMLQGQQLRFTYKLLNFINYMNFKQKKASPLGTRKNLFSMM